MKRKSLYPALEPVTINPIGVIFWSFIFALAFCVEDATLMFPSAINAYNAGYINKELEQIVGVQTDAPLKRAIMPNGGIRIVEKSCEAYNRKVSDKIEEVFHNYRKTHNGWIRIAWNICCNCFWISSLLKLY